MSAAPTTAPPLASPAEVVSSPSVTWPHSTPAADAEGQTAAAKGVVIRSRSPGSETPWTVQAAAPRVTAMPGANARRS